MADQQDRDLPELSLRELQEERSNLLNLCEHPAYKRLELLAKQQIEARRNAIFDPLSDLFGVLKQEYVKGEIAGITTFLRMIPAKIELLNQLIDEAIQESEDERTIRKVNESGD